MNLSEQQDRQNRELEAARRISETLFKHLRVEELVPRALETALEVVNCQEGSVLMASPEKEELVFFYSVGEQAPKPGTSFPWTEGIAGTVFSTGKPLVIQDVKQDQRHLGKIDQATGFTTHDMIALPLKHWEGHSIGVLEVMNKKDGRLDQVDLDILTIIAAFTALSIEQAHLFQETKLADLARILGDISQDINNLLIPVKGSISILKDELKEGYATHSPVDPVRAKASNTMSLEMIKLIGQQLKLIQERNREITDSVKGLTTPTQFSACFIQHVIGAVYDTLRPMANKNGIKLLYEGIQDLPEIQADESRLFNAFYNLVKNAISEVPQGGTILIHGNLPDPGDILSIEVHDSGRGIPSEIRDRLFAFPALSGNPQKGGIGLGTKIVKDVIDAHHGTISVESEVGKGTRFRINLPIDPTSRS